MAELGPMLDSRAEEPLRAVLERAGREGEDAAGDGGAQALLRRAVLAIAGLSDQRSVELDVITPRLLLAGGAEGEGVPGLLAGELLGDFGGFLSRELRASDFALGYESALRWMGDALPRCGVGDEDARRTISAVERRSSRGWRRTRCAS